MNHDHDARAASRQRQLISEYGRFIKNLLDWWWFVTITFRGISADGTNSSRCRPPSRDLSFSRLVKFLDELEEATSYGSIGWVLVEDFGTLGGRYHNHILISQLPGVSYEQWRLEAQRRFGRTTFDPYDPSRHATEYIAKRALEDGNNLHFGGKRLTRRPRVSLDDIGGGIEIVHSADVDSSLFHMTLGRRRRR